MTLINEVKADYLGVCKCGVSELGDGVRERKKYTFQQ